MEVDVVVVLEEEEDDPGGRLYDTDDGAQRCLQVCFPMVALQSDADDDQCNRGDSEGEGHYLGSLAELLVVDLLGDTG